MVRLGVSHVSYGSSAPLGLPGFHLTHQCKLIMINNEALVQTKSLLTQLSRPRTR